MTPKNTTLVDPSRYLSFLSEIKERIRNAQYEAMRAVNRELVSLYWDIGCQILVRQQEWGWGKAVVERLAKDLTSEFPRVVGLSARNLWRMRQLVYTYKGDPILSPLVTELSWSHNLVILSSCHSNPEREFYLRTAKLQGWSKNTLIHQIESHTYQRSLNAQTNFATALPAPVSARAIATVKDEYAFNFLDIDRCHEERELEEAILTKVDPFLKEMGACYTFVGRQYRLEVGGKEYFIDLLRYHRKLKCLVAIELKVGEFRPEYIGKMQFYLAVLDDLVMEEGENPSIGIILCKSKSRTIVEYTLRDAKRPSGVATYRVVSSLPDNLKSHLPAPEQIAKFFSEE